MARSRGKVRETENPVAWTGFFSVCVILWRYPAGCDLPVGGAALVMHAGEGNGYFRRLGEPLSLQTGHDDAPDEVALGEEEQQPSPAAP